MDQACVVTGGRGFVGRHLVKKLLENGSWEVRILDIAPEISLDEGEKGSLLEYALDDGRAKYICVDIRSYEHVEAAFRGINTVFHMASANPMSHSNDLHYTVSVKGTSNVINACVAQGVKKLIYTSSASVVFDGVHDVKNGDESLPYAEKPMDFYSSAKAQAEALVLSANGKGGLSTVALRPSGVIGPGEPLLVPKAAKNALAGRLKFIIGSGENMMDFTYVDNVVHAHLCAVEALEPSKRSGEEDPSGKAYFVTNGEPRKFWEFLFGLAVGLGYDPPSMKLPAAPLLILAYIASFFFSLLEPLGVPKSDFTPSVIRLSTVWRTFSCARAARLLGYAPPVPLEEGVRRTLAAFPHLRKEVMVKQLKEKRISRDMSKARQFLGNGQVADTLLWSNKKQTVYAILVLSAALHIFFISGYSLLSLLANLTLAAVIVLFFYNRLQTSFKTVFNYQLPGIAEKWELPEAPFRQFAKLVVSQWNESLLPIISQLFLDRSIPQFTMVMATIYLVKILFGSFHLGTFLTFLFVSSFTIPALYHFHEQAIDSKVAELRVNVVQIQGAVASKLPKSLQRKQD